MFRRYPYWGWLLLSISLWCINGYQYHVHKQAMLPERMAQTVTANLHHSEDVFEKFIAGQDLILKMFNGSLSEKESDRINSLPFYIYCYEHDTLKAWNTNIVTTGVNDTALNLEKTVILRTDKGVFLEKCLRLFPGDTGKKVTVLFPVLISYPLENAYLHSHFVASDFIPASTKIIPAEQSPPGSYPVSLKDKSTAFSLQFINADLQKWLPDPLFIAMLIAAMLASILWIQLIIIYITRKTSPLKGFFITTGIIIALLLLYYNYKLPFNLNSLTFFDSKLYASSKFLSSFGDLFVNTLCLLWIVVFITRHTPYKTYFNKAKNKYFRITIAITLTFILYSYVYLFVFVIRGLVRDSNISFDVSHFYAINFYTVLGLLVIGCITGLSCVIIFLFNIQLNALIKNKWARYLVVLISGLALVFVKQLYPDLSTPENPFDWSFYWALAGWLFAVLILLDQPKLALVSDLFEPNMVFWAIVMSVFSTGIIQYFNQARERDARVAYVKSNLSPQRDYELEFSFNAKTKKIEQDKLLKSFFYKPSAQARKAIDQHFAMQYLTDASFGNYQPQVYLFAPDGKELFNKDTVGYDELMDLKNESDPTNSPSLFYKEPIHDLHQYLSYMDVYDDTDDKVIGYILIDFDVKKQASGTVYPELLQSGDKASTHDDEYAVGTYVNDKLNTQTNVYPFANYLKNDTFKKEDEFAYYNDQNEKVLYYKISDKRTLVVVHSHSPAKEMITIFSYLFVIQVLLATIILLYQLYLSYFANKLAPEKLLRFTLRKRVHFSMLAVVFLSFLFIGVVTIWFFKDQYQAANSDKLESALQVATQSVQDDLKKEHANNNSFLFDTVTRSSRFKAVITGIANSQKIDLNIYNIRGVLVNTSEDDIYEKGLISRIMRPDAFYQMNDEAKSILIQNEQVAGLPYLSAYLPLRDEQGATMGYINVPFFSSQKDLNIQISNIVVSLINFYAFIFLLSSLFTVLLTRWITSSFNVIIKQFGMLNLQRNERIVWPYNDEIGTLVAEYNKMVNKVEENAARLAQSERESAWREMARQVAHEIKNPLTPMKLNIQFLQQAMRNDNANIKELTEKVSASIIEQIDNLSYIASEFSNFAKMPEARPEVLELCELLSLAVKLYLNDDNLEVTINDPAEPLVVYSDRSQLLRVFTNLLENAKQAIPADKQGIIAVTISKEQHGFALIAIADNGTGITPAIAEKIFQPYFTTKSSGTGLGLAMTRKIIEFWKGEIWFETKQDEGTTFYIRLPLNKQ